jgi:hypothetical protein
MKFNDLINRKIKQSLTGKKIEEVIEFKEFPEKDKIIDDIYDFATTTTANAEGLFNLTHQEGDLVYNSLLTVLKYLKNYPEE